MGRLDLEILQPLADRAGVGAVLDVVPLAGGATLAFRVDMGQTLKISKVPCWRQSVRPR